VQETLKTMLTQPDRIDQERRQTRTGARVKQLVEDVEADLSNVLDVLMKGREMIGCLETETKGINGLSAACRGWGQQLEKMLDDICEERDDVPRKLLGGASNISVSVNMELVQQVRVARDSSANLNELRTTTQRATARREMSPALASPMGG
jgi:hypothetical protein